MNCNVTLDLCSLFQLNGSKMNLFAHSCVCADQGLPEFTKDVGAVMLCFEASGSGSCGNDSRRLDWLVFSDDPKFHQIIHHNETSFVFTFFEFVGELFECFEFV